MQNKVKYKFPNKNNNINSKNKSGKFNNNLNCILISRIDDDPDEEEDDEELEQQFKQQLDMKYQEIDLEAEILKERAVDLNQVEEFTFIEKFHLF